MVFAGKCLFFCCPCLFIENDHYPYRVYDVCVVYDHFINMNACHVVFLLNVLLGHETLVI